MEFQLQIKNLEQLLVLKLWIIHNNGTCESEVFGFSFSFSVFVLPLFIFFLQQFCLSL